MSKPEQGRLGGLPSSYAKPKGGQASWRILCVHGLFGNHNQFGGWLERLSDSGFEAHAISLRGRLGTPPEGASGVALAEYIEDVRRALGELGPDTVLIGTSFGGLVCLKAIGDGVDARAAILLAPIHERPLRPIPEMISGSPSLLPRVLAGLSVRFPDALFDRLILNRVPAEQRGSQRQGLGFDSGRVIRSTILGAGAKRVRCPLLIVAGSDDRIVSARALEAMARRFNAEFRLAESHGHWLPYESGWEKLIDEIVRWLRDAGARSSGAEAPDYKTPGTTEPSR